MGGPGRRLDAFGLAENFAASHEPALAGTSVDATWMSSDAGCAATSLASAVPLEVMAIDPDSLLRDALALPASRRAELAADLLASLDRDEHDDPDEVRAAWATELERRARRAVSGEGSGRPWPEAREQIRSKLAQ